MVYTQLNSTQLYCDILAAEQLNSWIAKYTSCPEKSATLFFCHNFAKSYNRSSKFFYLHTQQ